MSARRIGLDTVVSSHVRGRVEVLRPRRPRAAARLYG